MSESPLRNIPSVNVLLDHERAAPLIDLHGREPLRESVRLHLDDLRARIAAGSDGAVDAETILSDVGSRLAAGARRNIRRIVNATGVILHTGLGRAVLPAAAIDAVREELSGYASLEVDVSSGLRSKRDLAVPDLLTHLTGAEDATIVNNNASAVLIVLAALARGREVIVSRGELVEIGGSFRVPDVMAESGAKLVEVGATNKTRIEDYANAITENTALLLSVHTSNFRIIGFTESVAIEQLSLLGKEKRIPVMHDVGSGGLTRFHNLDPAEEPTMDHSIAAGVDLVTASGDKLLGGPQAGLIVGASDLVNQIRKHPLARAVRVDKLQLAALEATLRLYGDPDKARAEVPALTMMSMALGDIQKRAGSLAARIESEVSGAETELADETSRLGSGSLPEQTLPTSVVVLGLKGKSAEAISAGLRSHEPPVFARIVKDRVLVDPRTLLPGDDDVLIDALRSITAGA